jgi:hypothetical protein
MLLKKVGRVRANRACCLRRAIELGTPTGQRLRLARVLDLAEFDRAATTLCGKYGEQYDSMTAQMDARQPGNNRISLR